MSSQIRDPDSVLDWPWDFTGWLAEGETITGHQVIPEAGITVDTDSEAGGVVTVWLSGGTPGQQYRVTVRITTSAGRTDDRTRTFITQER